MENNFIKTEVNESNEQKTFLAIDNESLSQLSAAIPWAKFIGIAGFIFSGLFLAMGISVFFFSPDFEAYSVSPIAIVSYSTFGLMFVLSTALVFLPSYFTYSFASHLKKAIDTLAQDRLAASAKNLKNLFLFNGIMLVIVLVFYAVVIIGFMIGMIAAPLI